MGRVLLEQRPPKGMWAGMWQAPTRERVVDETGEAAAMGRNEQADFLKQLRLPGGRLEVALPDSFTHQTTHREVVFRVWRMRTASGAVKLDDRRRWAGGSEVSTLGIGNAQRRALAVGGVALG